MDHSQADGPEVTREEVEKAVGKLWNAKSAGDDKSVAELLRNGGEEVTDWLLQTVCKTRQVPSEWKSSTLLPLHKTNDRKFWSNYCGISLLNVLCKVLALILFEQLQAIIETHLMDTQCGFRKERSTADQIWVTRKVVVKAREYQPQCIAVLPTSPRDMTQRIAQPWLPSWAQDRMGCHIRCWTSSRRRCDISKPEVQRHIARCFMSLFLIFSLRE